MRLRRPSGGESARGFTVVELIIVIGILLVVAGFGLFVGLDFYTAGVLDAERDVVLSVLRKARADALSNMRNLPHGVHIGGDSYILFSGSSYASRAAQYDETYGRSAGVAVSGASEVVFSPRAATSTASGSIVLATESRSSTIHINYEGRITW